MNRGEETLAIQDYLDDRLSPAERIELEERIARDPALARRVEELRAVGRALRESPAPLPEGFYERARARFERSVKDGEVPGASGSVVEESVASVSGGVRGSRARARQVRWPALGLAAASLLIAAILVPEMMRRPGVPPPALDRSVLQQGASGTSGAGSRGETGPSREAPGTAPAAGRDDQGALKALGSVSGGSFGTSQAPDRDRLSSEKARRASDELLSAPGEKKESETPAPSQSAPAGAASEPSAKTLLPKLAGEAAAQSASRPESRSKDDSRHDLETAPGVRARAEAVGRIETPSRFTPLPEDALPPGSVQVIEGADITGWYVLLEGPAGEQLAHLRPDFERERVVLVGQRSSRFGCVAAALETTAERTVLTLASPVAEAGASAGGCAFVIPAGTGPVEVRDPIDHQE